MPTNPIIYEHRRIIKPINTNPNIIQGFVQNFSKTSTYTLNGNIANTSNIAQA